MSQLTKSALALMVATILTKILGFVRELVLASAYGASAYTDAYLVALNIPIVILASIGTALSTSYIPLYYDITNNVNEKRARQFTNNVINIILILSIAIMILGIIFTKPLVKLFAIGFSGETLKLTIDFTRILILGVGFIAINFVLSAYLQIKNNFTIPGLISLPNNIIIISSIFLSLTLNDIYVLVWGTLLGSISQFIFQLPFAVKSGYAYTPTLDFKDDYFKKMMVLIAPVFLGVSVNQLNALVDKTVASTLIEGSISALNYANKLNGFVMGIFVMAISTVIYPMLADMIVKDDKENFKQSVIKSINSVILLVTPMAVGAMVLSTPIVKILFQRGSFDIIATTMTASALFYYGFGLVSFGVNDTLSRIFYSMQDTKTPMINGIIMVGINIILNVILAKFMGHSGLALATSISALIGTALLFISLNKKIGYFGQDKIISSATKSIISAIIMGIISKLTYNLISGALGLGSINEVISLGLSVFVGALVYGILILLFKVDEVYLFIDIVKSKLGRK